MDENIFNEQKNFFNIIDKIINEQKISHAYFLETNGYSEYKKILVEFCKRILNNNTSLNNLKLVNENLDYPEIKVLEANGKIIKKEDILFLKSKCIDKPILGKYIIYIIDGAEFLNNSSANTLLKFLEEPENNIIGILVSNNRYQVINTLISRCQILSLVPDNNNINFLDEVELFIKMIKNKNYNLFIKNTDLYSMTKEEVLLFLDGVVNYCIKDNNSKINIDIINIIEKRKLEFKYNLNTKLFIDNLILELLEV